MLALSFLHGCFSQRIEAQPVIYQATGPTRESIQPVVDQFKHDIVYGLGGGEQNPPPFLGSFKVATFDDVNREDRSVIRGPFESGGLTFLSLSASMFISASNLDPNNPNRLFGDIDPRYPSLFLPFSEPSALGITTIVPSDFFWVFNDSTARYRQNAFGAVFLSAGLPAIAILEGGGARTLSVTLGPEPKSFSFLGVIDPKEFMFVTTLRLSDLTRGPVAVDDVILGTAVPLPEPSSMILLLAGGLLTWITLRRQ